MPAHEQPGQVQAGAATISSGPRAPLQARTIVGAWLGGRVGARLHDDVRLLVSELVTNSVRHAGQLAGAPVRIRAAAMGSVVRVEVHDNGHGPVRRRVPDRQVGGFGLHLVDRLADRWGVTYDEGTSVWFELPVRRPGT